MEHVSGRLLSTTTNPDLSQTYDLIRQVTQTLEHGNQFMPKSDAKIGASEQNINDASRTRETKPEQQSTQTSSKVEQRRPIKTITISSSHKKQPPFHKGDLGCEWSRNKAHMQSAIERTITSFQLNLMTWRAGIGGDFFIVISFLS
ncbi:hypothetical protein FF1_037712 [Malus domestica]